MGLVHASPVYMPTLIALLIHSLSDWCSLLQTDQRACPRFPSVMDFTEASSYCFKCPVLLVLFLSLGVF